MREHNLRSSANWQFSLQQKDVKTGLKQGLCVIYIYIYIKERHRDTESVLMKVYGCTISLKAEVLPELRLTGPK